jgi:hypothetical protein
VVGAAGSAGRMVMASVWSLDRGVVDTLGRFNDGERSTANAGAVCGWTESLSSRDLVTVISNGNSKVAQGADAEPFVRHGFV